MVRNGINFEAAERIYTQLAAFADFGFAESHAASFALLVYVSAFLKVYYPEEFYCALLNAQPMGFYSPATVVYEGRRRGVKFLRVDVSRSEWDCTVENGAVRLGFCFVKGLGETAREKLETALQERPFRSVRDFVFKSGLGQEGLEQLALVGAFKCFGLTRRQAFWQVLSLIHQSSAELDIEFEDRGRALLPDMNVAESLSSDFKGMSLSTGPHVMQLAREEMKARGVAAAADLNDIPAGRTVSVAGAVVIRQRPVTAKGFLFITLEDETGFANIVVKPNLTKRFRKQILFSNLLIVRGELEKKDGVINLIGRYFEPFEIKRTGPIKLKSRDFR
jgi:DNA polymerase III alpha subunit